MGNGPDILDVVETEYWKKLGSECSVVPLEGSGVVLPNKVMLLTCPDGRYSYDVFHAVYNRCERPNPNVHTLSIHGGAARAVYGSYMNQHDGRALHIRTDIRDAHELGGYEHLVAASHWPCGMAKKHGYTMESLFRENLDAGRTLITQVAALTLIFFVKVRVAGTRSEVQIGVVNRKLYAQ